MAVVRKCVCCGKEYEYCPSCPKKDHPGWMVTFCCEECKELFNIISAYNTKRISKEAVREYMSEHKIDVEKYLDSVKKVFNEIKEPEVVIETLIVEPKESRKEIVEEKVLETSKPETSTSNVRSISSANDNYEHRPRRNKKRRTRQLDIELN